MEWQRSVHRCGLMRSGGHVTALFSSRHLDHFYVSHDALLASVGFE